jgi:hypothetical protein
MYTGLLVLKGLVVMMIMGIRSDGQVIQLEKTKCYEKNNAIIENLQDA